MQMMMYCALVVLRSFSHSQMFTLTYVVVIRVLIFGKKALLLKEKVAEATAIITFETK